MTEIMPVPRNLILLSYQQGASVLRFFLYFDNFCVIMNLSLSGGKALHTTAGGSAPLPKGGEAHANYFDIPYLRIGIYYQGKKREPPPWPVTVLSF